MTQDKIKEILDMLNTLNEYFLSLPDDMFLDINPRDNNSLETGVNFIKEFNNSLLYFTTGSNEIEAQIKNYFSINIEEDIQKENIDDGRSIRSIKELDNSKSYSLDEDFTYKRPFGFVLQGSAYKGLKTWKGLYVSVLKELQAIDISRFSGLTEEEDFISSRGNHLFSSKPEGLRVSEKLATDFYIEVNLSANQIRNSMKDLLIHFNVNYKEMKIYLREDRDA